jgi:sterol 14-demethylase
MDIVSEFFYPEGELSLLRLIPALILGYVLLRKILDGNKYAKYPPSAKGLWVPWLGHMFAFGTDPVGFFAKQGNEVGDLVSFTLFGKDCVLMIGNEAQKAFYDAPESVLSAAKTYKFTVPCFGPDVVYDASDEKFQQHRKFASKALTLQNFEIYAGKIQAEVENYLDEHFKEDEGILDWSKAINEITVLTSTACLQGPEIRAQVHTGYSELIAALDHALSAIGFFYPSLPLPTYRARDQARRKLGSMFSAILKHRRSEDFKGTDVLQTLMDARYADGSALTDNEIVGNLIALMMAGQHTSNITSSWLMINLLTSPEFLGRVVKEQEEVVGNEKTLTFSHVKKMELLQNCMRETLLKNPPIIVIWRTTDVDFEYKDYRIPAGTLVCVSPAAYPRIKKSVFTDAEKFDPDRFSRKEDKKAPLSYFPFSTGRHACIGEKFAYLQVKTIFSVVLRKFELELVGSKSDYPTDNTSLLAAPKGPVLLKYKRRK